MLIIAGVGVNPTPKEQLRKVILAGANVLRYNFSYRDLEENINLIEGMRETIDELNSSIKILIDLPINKVRLGDFAEKSFEVKENQELICRCAPYSQDCDEFIPVQLDSFADKLRLNQTLTIGDGEILFQVIDIIDDQQVKIRVLNNGHIKFMRTLNIDWQPDETSLLEKYKATFAKLDIINPDYIAVSYLNQEFSQRIKEMSPINHAETKIIARIEKEFGEEELIQLCQEPYYDLIMIDRGQLGVNTAYAKTTIIQKKIIDIAKKYKKPIIVSTHVLASTTKNLIPTRSDIADLTNLVLDGASGIMFAYVTTAGCRPAYTISVARRIITEAKKYKEELNKSASAKQLITG